MSEIMIFEKELQLISDIKLRGAVTDFLKTKVPEYFWTTPASSSGKYHPSFASGKGGLVRHTKMVVAVLVELLRLDEYEFDSQYKDILISSAILHDTFKHGYSEGVTSISHPIIAADEWMNYIMKYSDDEISATTKSYVYVCIAKHMGQWSPMSAELIKFNDSINKLWSLVHLADYIASRKFFDIDSLE